jgi:hypothetical protein
MQTLFPYSSVPQSAACLRDADLQSQIAHSIIIIDTLHEIEGSEGWLQHPAIAMWRGYEAQLCDYGLSMCEVGKTRGWNVGGSEERLEWHLGNITTVDDFEMRKPPWMTDPNKMSWLIRSHRSFLMGKDRRHYAKFRWNVPTGLPMYWPRADEK